jgi:2-polyprenyl-3-methyl-5-hydroxy-6-metoxy-1,4-benzoquinol methylase
VGHLREKYTTEYYLHEDENGRPVGYGVDGLEDFRQGRVRAVDRDILERIDFRGKIVLDLGCGRGEAVKYAAEHGASEVHGVDFSESAIAIASDHLGRSGLRASLHCADALEIVRAWSAGAGPGPFDVVMMLDCVEHIPRSELSEILKELGPMMAPRGILAVNTPAFGADNDVLKEGLNEDARDDSDEFESTAGMHCNRYTCRSLKRYLRPRGFAAISHHLFVANWRPPLFLSATRWSRRRAARLGYPILIPRALEEESYGGPIRRPWRRHPLLAPARRLRRRLRSMLGGASSRST